MATLAYGDVGAYFPDTDSVNNNTPLPCVVIDARTGGATVTVEVTDGDNRYVVGTWPGRLSNNQTMLPVAPASAPVAYSVTTTEANNTQDVEITANAVEGAAAVAGADVARRLAQGQNQQNSLMAGQTDDGWVYQNATALWDRRFGNDELELSFPVPRKEDINTIFVQVRDVNDPGGKITVSLRFYALGTGTKSATLETSMQTDGSGTIQTLAIPPTTAPSGVDSEMVVRITTGATAAPQALRYQLLRIYWTIT